MDDRVIPDIMNVVLLPKGRYHENFMLISQLKVCQEGGVNKGGTWRMLKVPDQRLSLEDRVTHDVVDVLAQLPNGSVFKHLVCIQTKLNFMLCKCSVFCLQVCISTFS